MNKAELVAAAAEKAGLTKKDTEAALNALIDTVTDALSAGEKVQLVGFGSFEVKERGPRTARNPKTNTPVPVAPTKAAHFNPGKNLKEAVGGKR